MDQRVKRLPAVQETWVQSLGQEDPLEKEMATHSSTLVWKIPWTETPGRLQSMGSQRVGHDWVTSLSQEYRRHWRGGFYPWVGKIPWRREWQSNPVFLPGKSHGQRSQWASVYGVTKSRIQRAGHKEQARTQPPGEAAVPQSMHPSLKGCLLLYSSFKIP